MHTLAAAGRSDMQGGSTGGDDLDRALARLREAASLALLLDYDGTLVPIVDVPELAAPDRELLDLLTALARRPGTQVHLVTGRSREACDGWFSDLPMALWAEHGYWRRLANRRWEAGSGTLACVPTAVVSSLERYVAATPGALIEAKSASIAWHYRLADQESGSRQARELRRELENALRDGPFEVLEGHKVLEVRPRAVSKASVVRCLLAQPDEAAGILAVGDNRTDDDMFGSLPTSAVTIGVGVVPQRVKHRVADPSAVRRILRSFLEPHERPRATQENWMLGRNE